MSLLSDLKLKSFKVFAYSRVQELRKAGRGRNLVGEAYHTSGKEEVDEAAL
jgi:hypothetical protein